MMSSELNRELAVRWERLRRVMAKAGVDAVVVTPSSNFRYLTGVGVHPSERLLAFVVSQDELALIYPSFEESRLSPTSVYRVCQNRIAWQETEDPYQEAVRILSSCKRIAVDPFMPFWQYERFVASLTGRDWVNAAEMLDSLRLIKSEWELDQIRTAGRVSAEIIDSHIGKIGAAHGGVHADVVGQGLISAYRAEGASDGEVLLQFDADSADPHGQSTGLIVDPNVVLIDSGANINGYWADLTRTHCYDPQRAKRFSEVYRIVWNAHAAAVAAVRPGVTAAFIDQVAREVITAAGYGEYFTHRVGHGLGLDIHEPPYLVAGNHQMLEPGMVFTIEPGIYLPGEFGVRIEDNVVVTDSGVEVLSPLGHRLEESEGEYLQD